MLTRNLYCKKGVELALIDSLIFRHEGSQDAYFWAYELYYSGLFIELICLFWQIYYDFYIIKYPEFEEHLKEYLAPNYFAATAKVPGIIVRNMLNNTPSPDIYLLVAGYRGGSGDASDAFNRTVEIVAHQSIDSAINATIAFTHIADHLADAFRTHVKYHPLAHPTVIGTRRILFAACAIYEYEYIRGMRLNDDDSDDGFIFITSYRDYAKYETAGRAGDLRACHHIKTAASGEFARGNNWIADCSSTPIWRNRIVECGGICDGNGAVTGPEDGAEHTFWCKWGSADPDELTAKVAVMASDCHLIIPSGGEDAHYAAIFAAMIDKSFILGSGVGAGAAPTLCRIPRPALKFTPVSSESAHSTNPLTSTIAAILGDNHRDELGWYMQILDRYDLTPESFAGVKYKGLKKYVAQCIGGKDARA
jgi:hypothetical protein